ncbi:hypothetical protein [uncultured Thiothrix sp.]|uniref:hypothetical protein n=1 Tax=uncultured Thiothrix sp. TaxID=223185 RepID=UPI0026143A41|nr:hypothetical protein [uncultured Thiothrix sp.]
MLKLIVSISCGLVLSAQVQAEMRVSSVKANSGQATSVSASIVIRVHIPVRATLKLSSDAQKVTSETNLQQNQGLILSCNNQQGLPLTHCSTRQTGQVYTLTTL